MIVMLLMFGRGTAGGNSYEPLDGRPSSPSALAMLILCFRFSDGCRVRSCISTFC